MTLLEVIGILTLIVFGLWLAICLLVTALVTKAFTGRFFGFRRVHRNLRNRGKNE